MVRHLPFIPAASTSDVKADQRAAALARRDALAPRHRGEASARAAELAEPLLRRLRPSVVSGYWPIRSEADPRPLLASARLAGAAIALPFLADAETMRFRLFEHDAPLVPAGFGTFGPPETADEAVPDLLVVPLAAFDRALNRIGYGKGHFDRAIARLFEAGRRPVLLGLAFAAQEVDKIAVEPHDIPLDYVVTERELIAASPHA